MSAPSPPKLDTPTARAIEKNEEHCFHQFHVAKWKGEASVFPEYINTWSFRLYRACPASPEMDERFTDGIRKIYTYVRFLILHKRYIGLVGKEEECKAIDAAIATSEDEPWSRKLAAAFNLDVVDDYPEHETARAGLDVTEGEEDFSAAARDFLEWVGDFTDDEDEHYVPPDHCLVLDEKALKTLEDLPAEAPEPGPYAWIRDQSFFKKPYEDAWVWIIDRKYFEEFEDYGPRKVRKGTSYPKEYHDEKPWPPWVRIKIHHLARVWFYRVEHLVPHDWCGVIGRDREKFDKVNWWMGNGMTAYNDGMRRRNNKRKLEEEQGGNEEKRQAQ